MSRYALFTRGLRFRDDEQGDARDQLRGPPDPEPLGANRSAILVLLLDGPRTPSKLLGELDHPRRVRQSGARDLQFHR